MGAYISFSSEIGGRALIGARALKGRNTVITTDPMSKNLNQTQTFFIQHTHLFILSNSYLSIIHNGKHMPIV